VRIALDATALPPTLGGAGNYIAGLVSGLRRLRAGDEIFVLCKPEDVDRLGPWTGSGVEPVPVRLRNRGARLVWEQTGLPRWLRRAGVDLVHSPHYTMPLNLAGVARVVTFHDMIFFLYPQHHEVHKILFFRTMIRAAARRADHVIADSESTRRDAMRLLDLPDDRITTIHLGVHARFRPVIDPRILDDACRRYRLRRPFVLVVSTLEPRKNLVGAIRAFSRVRHAGLDCQLAIVGARGWKSAVVGREIQRLDLTDHVNVLGFVADADLPALYGAAEVFLYPSFYEGFGLPPLEAMACGAAVVVSNRSSMPEVVGDSGVLCNPDSPDQMGDAVAALLRDGPSKEEWRRRALRRASEFSWDAMARQTHAVYEKTMAAIQGSRDVSLTVP
jgi:glycosyltransferase involved in cell wall biosynthesis